MTQNQQPCPAHCILKPNDTRCCQKPQLGEKHRETRFQTEPAFLSSAPQHHDYVILTVLSKGSFYLSVLQPGI